MNRLYVGNISFRAGEDELLEFISESSIHVEKVEIVIDRETGRSKGFGFITLFEQEDPVRAIKALNGKNFQGRPLTVNEARPRAGAPTSASYAKPGRR